MNAPAKLNEVMPQQVEFTLDGKKAQAYPGENILTVAKRLGLQIPHLCYMDGMRPDGNCRACVVEIKGERTLAPSCCRSVSAGMEVQSASERALKSQKMVLEMLLSDMPDQGYKWEDDLAKNDQGAAAPAAASQPGQHGELTQWASHMQVAVRPQLQALRREQPEPDLSHPAMAVNLDACIQ